MPEILATADLHGVLPEIQECDILIIAGDVCPDFKMQAGVAAQLRWLDTKFRAWLARVPAAHIIGIAGNHDFVFEKWGGAVRDLELPWIYLEDREVSVAGVTFHGIPWVPNLSRWAFHADPQRLQDRFAIINNLVDVVISHGPPLGFRDFTVPKFGAVHAGAPEANEMLHRVEPKAFVCGHIHEGYGVENHPSGAMILNVSLNTELYDPINQPMWLPVLPGL